MPEQEKGCEGRSCLGSHCHAKHNTQPAPERLWTARVGAAIRALPKPGTAGDGRWAVPTAAAIRSPAAWRGWLGVAGPLRNRASQPARSLPHPGAAPPPCDFRAPPGDKAPGAGSQHRNHQLVTKVPQWTCSLAAASPLPRGEMVPSPAGRDLPGWLSLCLLR